MTSLWEQTKTCHRRNASRITSLLLNLFGVLWYCSQRHFMPLLPELPALLKYFCALSPVQNAYLLSSLEYEHSIYTGFTLEPFPAM